MARDDATTDDPGAAVADDETIGMWFRVHPGYWDPPAPPSTANFLLRPNPPEALLSVWRMGGVTEAELRARFGLGEDVLVVFRTARQVRELAGGNKATLGLDVVPDPDHGGPAHAGILDTNGRPGVQRQSVKKALKRLFCDPWPP